MAKILVAEDERDIRDLITFTLQFAGHEVISVGDGKSAVDKAETASPDLIIMDVRMPNMTGYEACRVLKAQDSTKHIPIVFVSAKGQEQEVQNGLEAGALDYILKPFVPDQLVLRIKEILQRVESASKTDAKPETDTKPATETASKTVSKPETKAEPKAVSKPETEAKPKTASKPEPKIDPKTDTKPKTLG